ncbi:MAG: hypothetical protein GWP04_03285 [Gammaproteobacteria bacterium]|nr:hypothetical protein [Gammaproteobacteria bacterium]
MSEVTTQPRYRRFSVSDRVEHWAQALAFTGLAFTGLVQMWAEGWFSKAIIGALGGINTTRLIHHSFAVIVLVATVYHIGTAGYRFFVLRIGQEMLPGLDDARAAVQQVAYRLGLRSDPPIQGKFTFDEKMEYWSIIWGTIVMVATGLMMWNPISTTALLPGEFIPAAKAVHGGEAILAVLAILVWHTYHVHLRHLNRSMFDGYLTEEEMLEEHPAELAKIKAGAPPVPPVPPEVLRKRRRVFFAVYSVIAIAFAAVVVVFLTYKQVAIETIPPPATPVEIYVPYNPSALPELPTSDSTAP